MKAHKGKSFSPQRKIFFKIYLLTGVSIGLHFMVSPWIKIGLNSGQSMEGLIFLVLKKERPLKGQMIAFWPPQNQFYQKIWLVKYVRGVEGDMVKRVQQKIYINDEFIGEAKTKALNGGELRPSLGGRIPKGSYFVWAPHQDSYDSRYQEMGWITSDRVIGRVIRLF